MTDWTTVVIKKKAAPNNLLARQISRRALIKNFEFKLWFRCVFRDNFLLNLKEF